MTLSLRAKQIAGVTLIVGVSVLALSALYVARLSILVIQESRARGELLANAVRHRARELAEAGGDPRTALRDDPGLRAILQSTLYSGDVTAAAIVDGTGTAIAHSTPSRQDRAWLERPDLEELLAAGPYAQIRAFYDAGRTFEIRLPLGAGGAASGSVRIQVNTVLMRDELDAMLRPALLTSAAALLVALLVSALLARVLLRPIHVLRAGLRRLGAGETGVTLDLPAGDEFGEMGTSFNELSRQLTDRKVLPGGPAGAAPMVADELQSTLAYSRKLVALGRLTAGIAHEVKNPLNAMMIHLELLRTKIRGLAPPPVHSPRPVAAAGGTLGLAEREEPLTAPIMGALEHVQIIEQEVRRLDDVVQGFLKFTRPDELRAEPVRVASLFDEIQSVIAPEAQKTGVRVVVECAPSVPDVRGDASMLRQALLNLAINACQAMPGGGTLRLSCAPAPAGRVEITVADTGTGIPPEHLGRIFDLYFTTKDHGTGVGLSMVFRIIQMHDGEIEVESTPGRGTTFRILLPPAATGGV